MKIEILKVDVSVKQGKKAGSTYKTADVAFKNHSFDKKVEARKIVSFGDSKEAFAVLEKALPGEFYEIANHKDEASGYYVWTSATKLNPSEANGVLAEVLQSKGLAPNPQKSNYETAEERQLRQKYIIRQSSLSNALSYLDLNNGDSSGATLQEVLAVAEHFYMYVMDGFPKEASLEHSPEVLQTLGSLVNDDIPY